MSDKEEYGALLDEAMQQVAAHAVKPGDRPLHVDPVVVGTRQRTVIQNFGSIAQTLNRDPAHLARFIFKESARRGTIQGERLGIKGRIGGSDLKRLLQLYVKEFVNCPICGGFDTKIAKEKRFRFLICDICGAKSSIRKI